jgi:hypothetical protein
MSTQPFQLHSANYKSQGIALHSLKKNINISNELNKTEQLLSKENHLLKSSRPIHTKLLNQDSKILPSPKVNWTQRNQFFTKIPMRSSKNTIKLLKNLKSDKLQQLSSNNLFKPRNISPRKRQTLNIRRDLVHNSPHKPINSRTSQVVILSSVSPIISRKSRASRTSVKKMILDPHEGEEGRLMTYEENQEEQIKTKERNSGNIRKSKILPVKFYDEILMNASILSEKERQSPKKEKKIFNMKDVMRKSMELINVGALKETSPVKTSRHQSVNKSYFSRNTSQVRMSQSKKLVNNIQAFEVEKRNQNLKEIASSTNILPGNVIPTIDMFQSIENNSRHRSMSNCNSKTSMISRGSSNFKIVKRELNVSARMSLKKKTRLSHDLRAFKVNVEMVDNQEEIPKENNLENEEKRELFENIQDEESVTDESILINKKNFPKLFDLEEQLKSQGNSESKKSDENFEKNLFENDLNTKKEENSYLDSPFKLRNSKSKAIYESLSKDLKSILNKRHTKKLHDNRSNSHSIKRQSIDQNISQFEQKGIMTFRKRESKQSIKIEKEMKRVPPKEFTIDNDNSEDINQEAFDHMHISFINSTLYNSKVNNIQKKSSNFQNERTRKIDQIEADLNKIKHKKPPSVKRLYHQRNLYRQMIGTTPPKVKPRKSRSPLHLQPSPKFNPKSRMKKNYSQKYINTFKKNQKIRNKDDPNQEKINGYCSIKFAAMELKNQQKKLENILESCQNTFKKLDWNINNLEELKNKKLNRQEMKAKQNSYRQSNYKGINSYKKFSTLSRRNGSNKNSKKTFGKRSSRNYINELYKDFCKTLDFGKNNKKQKGIDKSNKILRLNLIKKKLNRL